jgi:hypothetical protein
VCEGADAVAFAASQLHPAWSIASESACAQHPLPGKLRRVMMILSCLMCAKPPACMARLEGAGEVCRPTPDCFCRVSHVSCQAARAAAAPSTSTLVSAGVALACVLMWPVVLPLLLLDELLQHFYDRVASKWQLTAGGEEILCAALYAVKACYMMVKIWVKQTCRLVRRQWNRAASRPGGLAQLARDTARGASDMAQQLVRVVAADPAILWTKVRPEYNCLLRVAVHFAVRCLLQGCGRKFVARWRVCTPGSLATVS